VGGLTSAEDVERIERKIANLEAEDATPALRQRIAARIAELEEAVEGRRWVAALAQDLPG
jgi:ribosome-interacting GTPase 1